MVRAEIMELESLRSAVPDCSVVRTRAPTYVRIHSAADSDVLLVSVMNKSSNPATANQTVKRESQEELDLTGSPLKLDLSLRNILEESVQLEEMHHWAREEAGHLPASIEDARNACNLYTKLTRELDEDACTPLWVVCGGGDDGRTMLLTARSHRDHFGRGLVTYEGQLALDEISFDTMIEDYMRLEGAKKSDVEVTVESTIQLMSAGRPPGDTSEGAASPLASLTRLHCTWALHTLEVPLHTAKISMEQEVVVGHDGSPCHVLWRSVCALDSINRALVDSAAAGHASLNLHNIPIRPAGRAGPTLRDSTRRLTRLLGEAESHTYAARGRSGGCLCVSDDSTSLARCLGAMALASSNDFTYQLWDILRDSETAEDMMTLLLHALKALTSGKIKPFVIPSNRTHLGRLALRLSRGHSQAAAALRALRTRPAHALALLGQLAADKTAWELTHLFTLLDNSFALQGVLAPSHRSAETIEQINQTLHDMTMGCGDSSLNPFDKSVAESSLRLDPDSFYDDDTNELTMDNFASLKKHGLVSGERKAADEVPLILDEIDTGCWKVMLSRFAQLFVCLEHLNRLQECLKTDITSLRPVAAALQQQLVSDKSPVKTVGQLLREPLQSFTTAVSSGLVRDQIANKPASLYAVRLRRRASSGSRRELAATAHVFSQQPVFPPAVFPLTESDANESNLQASTIKYHHTKYVELGTPVLTTHRLDDNKDV